MAGQFILHGRKAMIVYGFRCPGVSRLVLHEFIAPVFCNVCGEEIEEPEAVQKYHKECSNFINAKRHQEYNKKAQQRFVKRQQGWKSLTDEEQAKEINCYAETLMKEYKIGVK